MPVDSADPEAGPEPASRSHRRLRAVGRWLPAVILATTSVAATGVMAQIDGPPRGEASAIEEPSATPILSVRRNLDVLVDAAADRRLRTGLDAFMASQPADTCLEVEVQGFRYAHRADDPQSPASVQKLLTAVAALTELGPDHTFVTDALAPTPVGGVVTGDLYLRGGGDPVLATAPYAARERNQPALFTDIDRLADAVVAAGVTTITGAIVGDEGRYDQVRYNPVWPSRFIAQGQIGPLSSLSVNDGFAFFPENGNAVFGAAPDPAAYAATVFDAALRARGVVIGGPARNANTPVGHEVVASLRSPTVAEIVTQMLRESDNNTAELLLKELGAVRIGEGTFTAGQTAITTILTEAGIDMDGVAVADGSGLATEDVVTCEFVVDLLDHEPTRTRIRDGLPVAGESGTLVRRWADTDLAGRISAKTGTLNQVTALAGIADGAADDEARFALLVNLEPGSFVTGEVIAAQEQLVRLLVAYPDVPDVDSFRPGGTTTG